MVEVLDPWAKITSLNSREDGIALLKKIEAIAKISHRTEDKITEDSYDKFLRSIVMNHGDFSVIEHAYVTVEAEIDRGISHEWVRHRLAAYTQESTRFVNYGKRGDSIRVIRPPKFKSDASAAEWLISQEDAERHYFNLLKLGEPPDVARDALPTCMGTRLISTMNLRMWRHVLLMRTSGEAHPKLKVATEMLLTEFKEKVPIFFEDIEMGTKQSTAMRQLR